MDFFFFSLLESVKMGESVYKYIIYDIYGFLQVFPEGGLYK